MQFDCHEVNMQYTARAPDDLKADSCLHTPDPHCAIMATSRDLVAFWGELDLNNRSKMSV
jgi:hypothetical protein